MLKPLEIGDSVRVRCNVDIRGVDAVVYLDAEIVRQGDDLDCWLVEYQLESHFGASKYLGCWHKSAITSKHHILHPDKELFDKAEKINISDYNGVMFWDDKYFDSVEEIEETFQEEEDLPNFVWACNTYPVNLQLNLVSDVVESLEENGCEGLSDESCFQPLYTELQNIQDRFAKVAATKLVSFPNYKKAVIL